MVEILDATAGGRMMWFDKRHPDALYVDRRTLSKGGLEAAPGFEVEPDLIADFTSLPFSDESFHLVVFDPPHSYTGEGSIMRAKYGSLGGDWCSEVVQGLHECWRVLAGPGTLVFKWAETKWSVSRVLRELDPTLRPAFGHIGGKVGRTIWIVFYKGWGS